MISYTLTPPDAKKPQLYASGFKIADTADFQRLARGISKYVWSGIAWKDGVRRQSNFLFSDWCVLDFDSPEMPLAQALNLFCDCQHIIGTTKSHQKEKGKSRAICDRFRVAIPWERRIDDLRTHRYNMTKIFDSYPVDTSCKDGSRYFFPCVDIVSIAEEGYSQAVCPPPDSFERPLSPERKEFNRKQFARTNRLPAWVHRFIVSGATVSGGRSNTFFAAARTMAQLGLPYDEAERLLTAAPINRYNMSDTRMLDSIRNGYKKGLNDG